MTNKGTPITHVSIGGQSLDRDSITMDHDDLPVRFYRTNHPTIFAGFQIHWMDGADPVTGTEFDLASGAGMGSKYMTLQVRVPGHETVYEYVDMSEVLQNRISTIISELTASPDTKSTNGD